MNNATPQYIKSIDEHFYKVLKSGSVLHVNYSDGMMNIISPRTWEDVVDMNGHRWTAVDKEIFDQKAKATLFVLQQSILE